MNKRALTLEELKKAVLAKKLQEQLADRTAQSMSLHIMQADRSLPLSLSWAQQRLWFLDRLDQAAGAAYHIPAALRIIGPLDCAALTSALGAIVARHEALRTTIITVDEQPAQHIAPVGSGSTLPQTDLVHLPHDQRLPEALRLAAEEFATPFDLAVGPLLRCRLLRLDDSDHVLVINQHHIVSDGWSIGVLLSELSALYAAQVQDLPAALPALSVQYADYAAWQRDWLQGERLQQQLDYWREHLTGAPALIELPSDHPRPPVQSYRGNSLPFALDSALTAAVHALSQRHGTTLFMTLFAAFSVLLSRLSGQSDVVVGTPVANRRRAELEQMIGFFANTLALRTQVDGEQSVADLLSQVKRNTLAAYSHQDVPFDQVVDAIQPPRSLSHAPLFQVMLALDNTGAGQLQLPGLALSQLMLPNHTAHFDLTLSLAEVGNELACTFQYATDLFDGATIERMVGHLRVILEAMCADEQCAVARLPLLSAADRQQLVESFNDTAVDYSRDVLIHQLFEQRAATRPDAVAVEFEEQTLSYAELNARANQLAHRLLALGVLPDDRVALCFERSLDMVVSLLAILKAGAGYVPLDAEYPADRLAYMLDDAAPKALLTQAHLAAALPAHGLPAIVCDAPDEVRRLNLLPRTNPLVPALKPHHLAYVIYTSGSTGKPKGVANQHDGVVNRLLWAQDTYRLTSSDCVLQKTPFGFDVSVWEFFLPLLAGARLLLARPAGHKNPAYLTDLIEQGHVTTLHFVPSMLAVFLDQFVAGRCASVRQVLCSGEALPRMLQDRFLACLPHAALHNLYGPTEAAIDVTAWQCNARQHAGIVPIGRPVANTRLYILDAHDQPVPIGVTGELFIAGIQVARGYLNRPELTTERFLADPFSAEPGARMYKTGDLARWLPDGNIEYLGRNDFQVKIRGFRIELGEIEARLAACAGIREATVIAREDSPGDKRLVAYYIAAEGAAPSAADLRAQLAVDLPDFMLPTAFVRLATFPLTANGKLDRKALPAPDMAALISHEYEAPLPGAESDVAGVWRELLHVDRVGRQDSFFELGGHSLLAVTLTTRLRQQLGRDISVRDLFMHPVLADYVAAIDSKSASEVISVQTVSRDGPLPLSYNQLRLWLVAQMEGASEAYHMPYGLRLKGALDVPALRRALDHIVARHESLRTNFVIEGGTPLQHIAPVDSGCPFTEESLSHEQQLAAQLRQASSVRFDLARDRMVRAHLLHLPGDEHVLLVTMHHIASDGWSHGVLNNELTQLYTAFHAGQEDPLPPLAFQYADYAGWCAQWMRSDAMRRQSEYWGGVLKGAPMLPNLPTDRPRPAVQDYRGAVEPVLLDAALTSELRALAQRRGMTLYMVVLAAWGIVLSRLSGQDEIVVGTSLANRRLAQADKLIGFFVNTQAMRLPGAGSVAAVLDTVRNRALDAQENQELPFEVVMDIVKPQRSLAHTAIFQALLVWQNMDGGRLALPGLQISPVPNTEDSSRFDLELELFEEAGCIKGALAYATALFDAGTIRDQIGYMQTVLRSMLDNDEKAVERIELLSPEQREDLLVGLNRASAAAHPPLCCIHTLFEACVERQADATALVLGDHSLSYGQLNARANQLAHYLRKLQVGPDDRVAICVERSADMIVGMLAILKAGGAYVPLDPAYPVERLEYMLEDCAPKVVLVHRECAMLDTRGIPTLDLRADTAHWAAEPDTNPSLGLLTPQHMAYVIYTSGSTGKPKGVMLEHRNVVNLIHGHIRLLGLTPADRVMQFASYSFDNSVAEIFPTLSVGATLVMRPAELMTPDESFARFINEQHITVADLPTAFWHQWAQEVNAGRSRPGARLRAVLAGGEKAEIRYLRDWFAGLGEHDCRWINTYGPTEATVNATVLVLDRHSAAGLQEIPIGRPVSNARIYVLDAQGKPVPPGVSGEIHIAGDGVARGYLGRAELTAERFVADPFHAEAGARMYKTGDLGRWLSSGVLEYIGRNDFQVKLRGFRIELGEIEACLATQEAVKEVVVLAREDIPGDKRLVAYIVPHAGHVPGAAELRAHVLASLPAYMVPGAFVLLDALPLNPNNKIDRKALPAPGADAYVARDYEAPLPGVEAGVAEIWRELLRCDRVGRQDNFFELGGHSLLAITLIERMRQSGLQTEVRNIFVTPTLAALACVTEELEEILI